MPKPSYLTLDTASDRKELFYLLAKLSPAARLTFLDSCCQRSCLPNSPIRPGIRRDTRQRAEQARWDSSVDERLTIEIMFDLFALALQYQLCLDETARRLERLVSRQTK